MLFSRLLQATESRLLIVGPSCHVNNQQASGLGISAQAWCFYPKHLLENFKTIIGAALVLRSGCCINTQLIYFPTSTPHKGDFFEDYKCLPLKVFLYKFICFIFKGRLTFYVAI